jgi:hypothetical protein
LVLVVQVDPLLDLVDLVTHLVNPAIRLFLVQLRQ